MCSKVKIEENIKTYSCIILTTCDDYGTHEKENAPPAQFFKILVFHLILRSKSASNLTACNVKVRNEAIEMWICQQQRFLAVLLFFIQMLYWKRK